MDEENNVRDYLLSLDDLGQPKVVDLSRIENGVFNPAILCIIRLLVMRKGTDPDRPDMGIDITGRYRFAYDSELFALENEITEQIETYLPEFLPTTVETTMVSETIENTQVINKIQISITTKGTQYNLMYNKREGSLEI